MARHASSSSRRPSLAKKALAVATVALAFTSCSAANLAGTYQMVNNNSLASAMMLGVMDEDHVFILDKAENNSARLNDGRHVWGSFYQLSDNSVTGTAVESNTFCASGAILGNGTWVVAGGNQAVGYGGASQAQNLNPYSDYDGTRAIRLLEPGTQQWIDNPSTTTAQVNMMQSTRWYPGIEVLEDGSVIFIGGANSGGYINRNTPTTDTVYQNGGANPTYEYFPSKGTQQICQFMSTTNGLNMYPHTFLMPSGKIFMQANVSTILWNHTANTETALPDMPGNVVRVYPASGATAMLPLTPQNQYTPTILFCGGSVISDQMWGNYSGPGGDILGITASTDCSSITPEDNQGNQISDVEYVQEEQLPEGRSMGQFIHLPDGTMVILNGANKGTAGYTNATYNLAQYNGQTINTEGLAQDPTYLPVLYDPSQPKGQRLTRTGFSPSNIARLYHSSAVLLPDGSVMVAGSNPHQDVSLNMPTGTTPQAFNTTYEIEKWYPPYWDSPRPYPQGIPDSVTYGGSAFNITVNGTFMGDQANAKAANTKFAIIRPGFSTHAMNMGQRAVYLDYTYTVNDDASVDYMVNPLPNTLAMNRLLVPGPAMFFVTVGGVPSKAKMVMVGTSANGTGNVPFTATLGAALVTLPSPVNSTKYTSALTKNGDSSSSFGLGKIIGIAVAGAVVLLLIVIGCCLWRRKGKNQRGEKAAARQSAAPWTSRDIGSGPEYKRVDTPIGSVNGRFAGRRMDSSQTFESYRMHDQGSVSESKEALGGYYDQPRSGSRAGYAQSPLGHEQHGLDNSASGQYQQGWGEYHAGDAGAYYEDSANRYGGQSYDDYPQHGSYQQQYHSQQRPQGA
ncbi:probable glyoxaloxidase 1 [Melanopsichium pennsylvanicum]|uniref:Glyoxaloxidase 1 n=2 Tax=Melanopsichium pennsylvanicum TaxID=63383 RepID=A0A077R814_9BASI|nr:glyoxaloxidase 1 [Melanopsichium pennsylvanicum 4]SNX82079.1 probable glyoxaloxidase 1 [Melanopsichium pennsylvanicum]